MSTLTEICGSKFGTQTQQLFSKICFKVDICKS
jgi:hypothetical protein